MAKKQIAARTFLYPMPATLVGANVKGKPNFLTVAYCGIVNLEPPTIVVALGKIHYTNLGIKENLSFSVNVPSAQMAPAVDYCGLHTGHKVDKSGVFKVFYGKLGTAPMAEEAPINLECRLVQTVPLKIDEVFFGEIEAVYADEAVLADDLPLAAKIDPLIFSMSDRKYFRLGPEIGEAWKIGKDYDPKNR